MLNFVVEKGASKDYDQSGLSITSTRMEFMKRSRLAFGL